MSNWRERVTLIESPDGSPTDAISPYWPFPTTSAAPTCSEQCAYYERRFGLRARCRLTGGLVDTASTCDPAVEGMVRLLDSWDR